MKQNILLLTTCLLMMGCATIIYRPDPATIEQIESISTGMTVDQVQAILGKPYKITHLYRGNRDENIFIHQYVVANGTKPFDKYKGESGWLTDEKINEKFTYRIAQYRNTDFFNQVYYLQFVFEDSTLIKFEELSYKN
ncbi:MAG: hypothetical protein ACE5D7_02780 [Fidelibacterota bacterium]